MSGFALGLVDIGGVLVFGGVVVLDFGFEGIGSDEGVGFLKGIGVDDGYL